MAPPSPRRIVTPGVTLWKILKGAKPAELRDGSQPSSSRSSNFKAAKALGTQSVDGRAGARRRGDRMRRREFMRLLGGAVAGWMLVAEDIHATPPYRDRKGGNY